MNATRQSESFPRIGILGVGNLAGTLLTGFIKAGMPPDLFLLSPRGQAKRFAATFGMRCAADNAALVRETTVVLLTVKPGDAAAAVAGLPWNETHLIVSACASVATAELIKWAAPASICRIMPLTVAAFGASPTTLYPDVPIVRRLLGKVGSVIPVASEREFEVATVSAAIYGWLQFLAKESINWQVRNGCEAEMSRQLIAATLIGAGQNIAMQTSSLDDLMLELVTPGGITECGLKALTDGKVDLNWAKACEAVFSGIRKKI